MNIIAYPLNGITYDAEDVGTYLCTRTSGVYAKDTNYAVSITGARELTVAPGLAWINYEDFKGVSVCSREAVTLNVPAADTTLPRVDRIVLQFDVDANASAVKLKPGTPSAAPEPPAIQQNHRQYELGLATLTVPAGTASITAANLTDTRTDEDVCGIMRDGVTGIPTAQLLEQWQAAQAQQDAEARQAAAAMLRTAQEQITAQLDSLQQQADDLKTAIDNVESGSFYTKAEVDALVRPYSLPAATSTTLGGIKVGDNLSIDADGTLSGAAPYALPAATTSTRGGVIAGSNLTVYADGTLALEKSGVIGALGYTPAQVTAGTADLTAGSSYLATGALYVQYATGTSDEAVDDTDIHMPEDESAQDGEPAETDEEVQA